jgi:hypothetical protein
MFPPNIRIPKVSPQKSTTTTTTTTVRPPAQRRVAKRVPKRTIQIARPSYRQMVNTVTRPVNVATSTINTNMAFSSTIARSELAIPVVLEADSQRLFDFSINPSNHTLFPWLSNIAPFFDMYSFKELRIRYVPSCPSTTQGQFTMAIDYDPTDSNTGIQQAQLASMAGSLTTQLYTPCVMNLNLSSLPVGVHKFYTSSDDSYTDTARFNHVGRLLYIVSADPTAKTTYGSIFVDYTVVLYNLQDVGPGYTTNASAANNNAGNGATDPLGLPAKITVESHKPDEKATTHKTKRVVRVLNDVATVVAQVAPFLSAVAKALLPEYMPDPMLGHFYDLEGVETLGTLADVPGDTFLLLKSSECRKGTLIGHFYGTYTNVTASSYPYIAYYVSANLKVTNRVNSPNSAFASYYTANVARDTTVTSITDFEFLTTDSDVAWIKPTIAGAAGGAVTWVGKTYGFIEVVTKAPSPITS